MSSFVYYRIVCVIAYIAALILSGRTRSSNFRMSFAVCSASERVRICKHHLLASDFLQLLDYLLLLRREDLGESELTVCGNIRAKCAKKPLYTANRPSVFTVRNKQSKADE